MEISNPRTRSEKMSWDRKMNNIQKLIDQMAPIQQSILELMSQKNDLMDQIADIRSDMIQQCIHPDEFVAIETSETGEKSFRCKFCERKIANVKLVD